MKRKNTNRETMVSQIFTVEQAAEFLKVGNSAVYEWCNSGRLECYRLGEKTIRISDKQIMDFLEREGKKE